MNQQAQARLVLATTVWKRPELTEVVLGYYHRIQDLISDRIDLTLLAVGSEGRGSREACIRNGFEYIETANEPVTHKWNAVVRRARSYDPRGVILVNSDDVVSPDLFPAYLDRLAQGVDYIGLRDAYIFDLITETLGRWPGYEVSHMQYRVGEPAGCARCFSRRLLEKTGWRLWASEPPRNSKMDFWCTQFLALFGFKPEASTMDELGVEAIQLKTDVNITPFDSIPLRELRAGRPAWRELDRLFEPREVEVLRVLCRSYSPEPRADSEMLPDRHPYPARPAIWTIEDLTPTSLRDQVLSDLEAMRRSVAEEGSLGPSNAGVASLRPS